MKNIYKINNNIYITSDEEIKEGDYAYHKVFGIGKIVNINGEDCFVTLKTKPTDGSVTTPWKRNIPDIKKIILTTDQDLIKDGVQAIDDEFLEWFVKNPSCEEVEVESFCKHGDSCPSKGAYDKQYLCDVGYKIIISQEDMGEKKYTEEDIKKAFMAGCQSERRFSRRIDELDKYINSLNKQD